MVFACRLVPIISDKRMYLCYGWTFLGKRTEVHNLSRFKTQTEMIRRIVKQMPAREL